MKHHRGFAGLLALALPVVGLLTLPVRMRASDATGATRMSNLLADSKAEAIELKRDSADMLSYTESKLSWANYAEKVEMIKGHINATGKLVAKLKAVEDTGFPWQRTAVKRIEPLLRELAANTEATINYLNNNQSRVNMPPFKEYVKSNFELAGDLEALIRDFVSYGESKDKREALGNKLEISR